MTEIQRRLYESYQVVIKELLNRKEQELAEKIHLNLNLSDNYIAAYRIDGPDFDVLAKILEIHRATRKPPITVRIVTSAKTHYELRSDPK